MSLRGSRRPRGRRRCPSSTASATAAMPLRTRSSALCPPPTSGGCRASSGNFSAKLRSKPATCSSSPPTGRSPALPESWRPGPFAGGKSTRTTLCACRTPGRLFSTSRRPRSREIYRHDGSGYRPCDTRRERAPHEPAHVSAHSGVHHRADIPADVQQQRTAHRESPRRGRLRRLRAVRKEVPRAGHRDAGRQARLGQGQVRDVSRLSASMSEICIPSVDKGKHGFGGQKCAHTSSKSLTIRQVFSAAFSSSGHISAPSKLLRT